MSGLKTLILEASDIASLVGKVGVHRLMDDVIEGVVAAIKAYDPSVAQVPPRGGVHYLKPEWGLIEAMPAHFGESGTTVKLVGYHPANPVSYKVPSVVASLTVFDAATGHLVGFLDGTFLTALRTGAASAVASKFLASPDSRTVGIVGCGAQAVTQLHALSRCFEIDRVIAYDRDPDVSASLRERIRFLDLEIEVVNFDGVSGLLERSDILCTCTSSAPGDGPIFEDFANRPHLHINAIGSDFRGKIELPFALLKRSVVCPDFHAQAIAEGDCQQLEEAMIGPDLRTVIQDEARHTKLRNELTVFDSTGWALEDHVSALIVLDYARKLGLGRDVVFECLPPDPKDPYSFLAR
jgi:ornithine cyclodeaminase/alanine dehydrogenase-like protein (mu-crystallin family)